MSKTLTPALAPCSLYKWVRNPKIDFCHKAFKTELLAFVEVLEKRSRTYLTRSEKGLLPNISSWAGCKVLAKLIGRLAYPGNH